EYGSRLYGPADVSRFIQRRDENRLAAGGGKRTSYRFGAATIGVRLDHAGTFGRYRGLLQLAPVRNDGVEVDGQDAGRGGQRRRLVGLGREKGALRDRFRIGDDVHAAVLRAMPRWFNRATCRPQ